MYQSHWGLCESPFRSSLDPKYFYCSPSHNEALARLHFLVENGRRLGLLLGRPGSGKSLLLKILAQRLRRQGGPAAQLNLLGLDADQFLWTLASQLALNVSVQASRLALWRRISDRLAEHRYQRLHTVLLLDDADEADDDVLRQAIRLLQMDPSSDSLFTVIMAADPARQSRLGKRLLGLAELRIELEPWDAESTTRFLRASISKAGGQAALFEPLAALRLHELTRGVPRRVTQLADLALLAGAGRQADQIDRSTVESVYEELSVAGVGQ